MKTRIVKGIVLFLLGVILLSSHVVEARRVKLLLYRQVRTELQGLVDSLSRSLRENCQILQTGIDVLRDKGKDGFIKKARDSIMAAGKNLNSVFEEIVSFCETFEGRLKPLSKETSVEDIEQVKAIHSIARSIKHDLSSMLWASSYELYEAINGNKDVRSLTTALEKQKRNFESAIFLTETYNKIIEDGISVEEIDVNSAIMDIANHFRDRIEEKWLKFSVKLAKENIILKADRYLFTTAIWNLLDNALKYTSSGSITLRTSFAEIDEDRRNFIIEVKDTGIGIPKGEIEHVFEGQRASNVGEIQGTGAGLAFVDAAVSSGFGNLHDYLGSRISLKSTVNKGTTVAIIISLWE